MERLVTKNGDGAEAALSSGDDELPLLADMIPTLVWRAGPDGFIEYVNKRVLDYFGAPLSEIIGWGWVDRVHPDDAAFKIQSWLTNLETENPHDVVCRFRGADGQHRWFNVRGEPLRACDGRVLRWYGVLIDVDRAKKEKDRLRVSEAHLAGAQKLGRSGASAFNESTILNWSEETYRIWGFDPGFGVPSFEAVFQRIHPDDRGRVRAQSERGLIGKSAYSHEYRIVLPDGTVKHIESIREPVLSPSGEIIEIVATQIDVTERKRAEEALRDNEYKLRQIFETVPGLLWSTDPAGEPTQFNQRMLDYTGMRFEDFKHGGWEAFVHPDDFPETARAFRHAIETGTSYQAVHRLRRSDGECRWHHTGGEPLRDGQGRIIQWYGLCVDIDEAKMTEDRLRRSEAYLAEAQRLSHTGSAVYNETKILHWSEEASLIYGFDPALGVPSREAAWQRIHPDDLAMVNENIEQGLREKRTYRNEFRIILPDGTVKHIEATNRPVFSESGELLEVACTGIDVTARKQAEQALRESEYKLRQLLETVPGLTWSTAQPGFMAQVQAILDVLPAHTWYTCPSGAVTFVNKRAADYLGLPKDHPLRFGVDVGAPWDAHIQLLHPDDQEGSREAWSNSLRTGEAGEFNFRVRSAQGDHRWFLTRGEPLRASDGTLLLWMGVNLDIEELKGAEQAVRESEAKFRDYAETASDWFWEIGPDYKFTLLTENAFGSHAADRIGTACWDHALDLETEPEKWRLVWAALDARMPFRDFVYRVLGDDGSSMYVKASGKPVFDRNGEFHGYRGTGTNVTALILAQQEHERLRQLESDLAHMTRLSVMGELTASLAHEITQPIAAARNNARAAMHFLDKNPPDPVEIGEALASIVDSADRAGDIIDRIRDHIKKAPPRKARFALNKAFSEVIGLAQSAITANGVSVTTHLTEGLSIVEGDRVQLQQVMLNLILNAVEAMRAVDDRVRELSISTEQMQTGGVLVSVHDSGPGIDPDRLDDVFQAFYTTKPNGVGMGLSISRSIIDAHGGRLWADTNSSGGAVFRFSLPGTSEPH